LIVLAHQFLERSVISLLRYANQFGVIYPTRALPHHAFLWGISLCPFAGSKLRP
jgi:hypothetical protein